MEKDFILVWCRNKGYLEKFNDFIINVLHFHLEPDQWVDGHYYIYKVYIYGIVSRAGSITIVGPYYRSIGIKEYSIDSFIEKYKYYKDVRKLF